MYIQNGSSYQLSLKNREDIFFKEVKHPHYNVDSKVGKIRSNGPKQVPIKQLEPHVQIFEMY